MKRSAPMRRTPMPRGGAELQRAAMRPRASRLRPVRDVAEGKLTRLGRRLDEAQARGYRTVPVDTIAEVLDSPRVGPS